MKKVTEKELIKIIFEFFKDDGDDEVILLPNIVKDSRWYITKDKNCVIEYIDDQPLLKKILSTRGITKEKFIESYKKRENEKEIGTFLRFYPALIGSSDPLLKYHNIQPYQLMSIEDLPRMIVEVVQENYHNIFKGRGKGLLYSGPFVEDSNTGETICYVDKITKEDFRKDVEEFRKGSNQYHINIPSDSFEELMSNFEKMFRKYEVK